MTGSTAAVSGSPAARLLSRALHPVALTSLLVALSGAVWVAAGLGHSARPFNPIVWAFVLLAYCASASSKLHIEVRRHTYSLSLSEIPLVVGLFWLPPWSILVAAVLAEATMLVRRRTSVERMLFNLGLIIFVVCLAASVFAAAGGFAISDIDSWPAAYAATESEIVASALAVVLVITHVQGKPRAAQVWSLFGTAVVTAALTTTLALVILLAIHVTAWASALVFVIVGVFVLAYRSYAGSVQQRKSLNELYEFTRAVGTSKQGVGLADTVLERTREFLKAEGATLWLPAIGPYPEMLLTARVDEGVRDEPLGPPDPVRALVMAENRTMLVAARSADNPEIRRALHARRVDEVIVTPLRSGDTVIGVLEVTNRLGDVSTFGPDDARLLKTLAAHAGVAVENSRLVDRLRHDAYHDALTGLPNRRRFSTALDEAIAVRPAPNEVVAVVLLDLDSFKDVNDTLGHVAGDQLLAEVGHRLRDVAPQGALVARMGGDEYALLLRLPSASAAQREGLALLAALTEPIDVEGMSIDARASVGIALFPDHAVDGGTLLQRAEVAMYEAKGAVRQVQTYQPAMDSRSTRRLSLVSELRRAIEEQHLTVYYQPKVSLADQELVGVEALVRWHHPERGVIDPDDFIPIAEHTGLIGVLTSYVLESALRQCRAWLDEDRYLHVAVNVSTRSLVDSDFADDVDRLLHLTGVPASMLTLEITESSVMSDIDRALPTLHRLRDRGVRLSVDDFGTGHSSLTYLRRLPVDEVKIDKTFVLNMATDSGDLAIVRAIVDLGRHLGLTVVAEGVESEIAYTLLRDIGCDMVQGFLLSRPVPYERLETWIRARTVLAPATAGGGVRRLRVAGA